MVSFILRGLEDFKETLAFKPDLYEWVRFQQVKIRRLLQAEFTGCDMLQNGEARVVGNPSSDSGRRCPSLAMLRIRCMDYTRVGVRETSETTPQHCCFADEKMETLWYCKLIRTGFRAQQSLSLIFFLQSLPGKWAKCSVYI